MPSVNIYFIGLVCHVRNDSEEETKKDHAVLVRDKDHVPFVAFLKADGTVSGKKLPLKPGFPSRIRFEIGGRRRKSPAEFPSNGDFDRMVPKLGQVADKPVKASIRRRTNKTDAAAYVDYPGGVLHVHSRYAEAAEYNLDGQVTTLKSVAKATVLVVDTESQPIEMFLDDKSVAVIPADGCVVIGNPSKQTGGRAATKKASGHLHGAGHFKRNLVLLEAGAKLADISPAGQATGSFTPPQACKWVNDVLNTGDWKLKGPVILGPNIECSNTGYP